MPTPRPGATSLVRQSLAPQRAPIETPAYNPDHDGAAAGGAFTGKSAASTGPIKAAHASVPATIEIKYFVMLRPRVRPESEFLQTRRSQRARQRLWNSMLQ